MTVKEAHQVTKYEREVFRLQEQLATANADTERLTNLNKLIAQGNVDNVQDLECCVSELKNELATAQRENKRLRMLLIQLRQTATLMHDSNGHEVVVITKQAWADACQALATPPRDEALRNYVADEMVKMADTEIHNEWLISQDGVKDYAERYRKGEV